MKRKINTMKKQFKYLIERANKTVENHHEMDAPSIALELKDLKANADLAEAELIVREDECEADSEALSKAIEAINKVRDALEYHRGGGATQF
jgi:hypothetical protein